MFRKFLFQVDDFIIHTSVRSQFVVIVRMMPSDATLQTLKYRSSFWIEAQKCVSIFVMYFP